MSIDINKHREQVEKYKNEYETYKKFSETLEKILNEAKKSIAPLAIIQVRTKTIPSFAEKAIRKADKYSNPVEEFTDLSGARVIANTLYEVDKFRDFIERTFVIDKENSLDVKARLKANEFGYLSVHYIISLSIPSLLGIEIPEDIRNKKAEIQVRTLLQHAWSEMDHDRLYKGGFLVPQEIIRESRRLAAVMENADKDFLELSTKIDAMKSNYSKYMNSEKRKAELDILRVLLENTTDFDNKVEIILEMTKLLKADSAWKSMVDILEPWLKADNRSNIFIQRGLIDLGQAYCMLYKNNFNNKSLLGECRKSIEKAKCLIKKEIDNESIFHRKTYPEKYLLLARGLTILAETFDMEGYHKKAKEYYFNAYHIDPSNPYIFEKCMEYKNANSDTVALLTHTLNSGIEKCETHIRTGMELPKAYFTKARFKLILKKYEESLFSYIEAINYCTINNENNLEDLFESEIRFISNWVPEGINEELERRITGVLRIGKDCFKLKVNKDSNCRSGRIFNKLVLAGGWKRMKALKMSLRIAGY